MAHCLNCLCEYDEEDVRGICPYCGYRPGLPPKAYYHIMPGSLLHGRYEVGTVIGSGGFGITYHAWDTYQNMPVAVKEYYPKDTASRAEEAMDICTCEAEKIHDYEEGVVRFLEEGRNLMFFNNTENIVHVYDFFEENNTAYIIMEFLRGESLSNYCIHSGGVIYEEDAIKILFSIIDCLHEIHRMGMIHRDVSPDNIFMCTNGSVKLIDFGAARKPLSSNGISVLVKPNYAPPEQFDSNGSQGPWTDIYALGATMYRIVSGKMPPESVSRLLKDNMKKPSEINPKVSEAFSNIIMKCMGLRPEDRYQNVNDIRIDIIRGFVYEEGATSNEEHNNEEASGMGNTDVLTGNM